MLNNFVMLKTINPVLIISFLIQASTAVLLALGVRIGGAHLVFDIHKYNGFLLITLALAHFTLNFGWIKSTFFKRRAPAKSSSGGR